MFASSKVAEAGPNFSNANARVHVKGDGNFHSLHASTEIGLIFALQYHNISACQKFWELSLMPRFNCDCYSVANSAAWSLAAVEFSPVLIGYSCVSQLPV